MAHMTTTNGNDNLDLLPGIASVSAADAPVSFTCQSKNANQWAAVMFLYGRRAIGSPVRSVHEPTMIICD